ncbi:CLUMA_CG021585, isoform A [Clunio marinus]|uniref:CLUMA_CG021585, isoform A n=1 Tax=Clunio marinus TaxID=568069 RepID=A0A1J1J7R3_9DIPT|nr:CLUMA_CG021585, isoform A [Clunio marinus]
MTIIENSVSQKKLCIYVCSVTVETSTTVKTQKSTALLHDISYPFYQSTLQLNSEFYILIPTLIVNGFKKVTFLNHAPRSVNANHTTYARTHMYATLANISLFTLCRALYHQHHHDSIIPSDST